MHERDQHRLELVCTMYEYLDSVCISMRWMFKLKEKTYWGHPWTRVEQSNRGNQLLKKFLECLPERVFFHQLYCPYYKVIPHRYYVFYGR